MSVLQRLLAADLLAPVDVYFADALARLGNPDEATLLGAAFASRALTWGHICVVIPTLATHLDDELEARDGITDRAALDCLPEPSTWLKALAASSLVRGPAETTRTPLVLHEDTLYLDRYWMLQRRLVDAIEARQRRWGKVDPKRLREDLDRLFPPTDTLDRQRLAALLSATRRFTVVVGGPGTGKTHTVVKMLALMLEQARANDRWPLRIALVAPTGKAAARMGESIRSLRAALPVDDIIRDAIPDDAATIHRALGARPNAGFTRNADNPLPADVVVVDEASMVDLAMMSRLIDAVPADAHLVLLGDRDQLASVEAGAVLGDICAAGGLYSTTLAKALGRMGVVLPDALVGEHAALGIGDATVELTHTWRFGPNSGIRALADAINAGDASGALAVLKRSDLADVDWVSLRGEDPGGFAEAVREHALRGFASLSAAASPVEALAALGTARILCAHRGGPRGVYWTNDLVESWLADVGAIDLANAWYRGRPVMVTRNDPSLGLYNGDVGVTIDGQVWFPSNEGEPRPFAPARLPNHETVYATTVHKSQGSEFGSVVVVLPDRASPIVTRALLYTAVTRATKEVLMVGEDTVFRGGVETRNERASGLRLLLGGADGGEFRAANVTTE